MRPAGGAVPRDRSTSSTAARSSTGPTTPSAAWPRAAACPRTPPTASPRCCASSTRTRSPSTSAISFDLPGRHLPPRAVHRVQGQPRSGWTTTSRCSSPTCAACARSSACPILERARASRRTTSSRPWPARRVGAGLRGRGGLRRQGPPAARERRRARAEPGPRGHGRRPLRPQDGRGEVGRAAGAGRGRAGPRGRRRRQHPRRGRHRRQGRARPGARVRAASRPCSTTRTRSSATAYREGLKNHRDEALLSKQLATLRARRAGRPSTSRPCKRARARPRGRARALHGARVPGPGQGVRARGRARSRHRSR